MSKKNKGDSKGHKPLTLSERITIELRYRDGNSITNIGKELGRNKSTISREVAGKACSGNNKYNADAAHRKALGRIGNRGNISILEINEELRKYVVENLKIGWSAEQISIRLPIDYTEDKTIRISHEAIYQYVYNQVRRGGNGKVKEGCEDLRTYLPRRHKRRAKKGFRKAQKADRKENIPSIENRPSVVEKRSRVGDWEDDFLVSRASKVCIKSVNERKTGIVLFGRTKDGTAKWGDVTLFDNLKRIPSEYLLTLTRDNGAENKDWETVEKKLGLFVFFAHPYHSWERGSNENCNGLLRRFFPKGTDWSKVTDEEIAHAEYLINNRPRKRFGGLTPVEVFYQETSVALYS